MNAQGQTICLNMIVKNEAPVIRRCLDSVRAIVDYWVIVDTGSTDGTQAVIREHFRDVPGELVERPWVHFAHNRSEALAYARGHGDYVLVIDADETLEYDPPFTLPELTADSYDIVTHYGGTHYLRKQLVKNRLPWRYAGVLHEYIECEQAQTAAVLPGLHTVPHPDGARAHDPLTYRRDALLLEQALLDEPENQRYVFYLAQSYRDAGDAELALRHYRRRATMGGWAEEVWFSLYQVAQMRERLDQPWPEVMEAYLTAYAANPARIEPLFQIATHYQRAGDFTLAHLFFAAAMQVPPPPAMSLFVEAILYAYLLPLEHAVVCYYVGRHADAIRVNNALLRTGTLPPAVAAQVIRNRRFSLDAVHAAPAPTTEAGPPAVPSPPLRVCLPLLGADPDGAITSLLSQSRADFTVTLLETAAGPAYTAGLPGGQPRFSRRWDATALSWDEALERFIQEACAPGDLVLLLPPGARLADAGALDRARAPFDDPRCLLAYGAYLLPSGAPGAAEPAPDAETFAAAGARLVEQAAVILRAAVRDHLPARAGGAAGLEPFVARLLQAAGFAGTRFLDEPLTRLADPPAA